MKKRVWKIVISLLILGMIGSVASCGTSESDEPKKEAYRIWSTYNTLKVLQEKDDYPDLGAVIDVFMAKSETEGAQIIVTPEKDVESLVLEVADIKMEDGTIFSKEKMKVYYQKYINVEQKSQAQNNINYPAGYTPDMLLPMEKAIETKENIVSAGKNQGITIEFSTDKKTKAGLYQGEFQLKIDDEIVSVPVKLQVYDVDITKVNGKTSIRAISMGRMNGEYDNTPELYREYYEQAMNEYKFNWDLLPGSSDPEQMAESAVLYWGNPNFTSFKIPVGGYSSSRQELNNTVKKGEVYSYLYALAKQCEPGRILFERAYMYPLYLDEVRAINYEKVGLTTQTIYDLEDLLIENLDKEGYFDAYDAQYRKDFSDAVRKIPIVITVDLSQLDALGSDVNTYCPAIGVVDTDIARERFAEAREQTADRGGETWFYTCMQPLYPWPTHHIDDALLGQRVMRWMQKEYDWEGYLHWAFNQYHIWTGSEEVICNPYEESDRSEGINGDGFMVYPGKKYDVEGFLPSLRLATFRDGQEDYDLLCALEEQLKEKASYYGLDGADFSIDALVSELYESLYTGTVYVDDDELFYAVRRELFEIIEKQHTDTQFLIKSDVQSDVAISDIYVAKDYSVKINGKTIKGQKCGKGSKYNIVQPLTESAVLDIEILCENEVVEKHHIFVSAKTVKMNLNKTTVQVSNKSTYSCTNDEVEVVLKTWGKEINEILTFVPAIQLDTKPMGETLDKLDSFYFTVANKMNEEIEIKVRLRADIHTYELNSYKVGAKQSAKISIGEIYKLQDVFSHLSDAKLEIYVDNADENNNLLPSKSLRISDVYYTVKEEG